MNQLSCILLHVNLMDTNFLGTSFCLDFHIAVPANGRVQLRNLVILGVIRIEIILPVKFAVTGDGTIGGQTHGHSVLYHFLIQHRQGTGHTGTHRTGMGVGRSSKCGAAGAENLGFSGQLYMDLQTDDGLILFTHFLHSFLISLACKGRPAPAALVSVSRPDNMLLFEAVAQKLQADGQSLGIHAAGQADSGKSGQVRGNGVDIAQIHLKRIGQGLSKLRRGGRGRRS